MSESAEQLTSSLASTINELPELQERSLTYYGYTYYGYTYYGYT